MTILIPLYIHPLDDPSAWRAVASAGASVTAIVNVHNGPGSGIDPVYAKATRQLRDAGVPLLGYVDLGYSRRSRDAIEEDLKNWCGYSVSGVFFDQAPSALCDIATVARYVHLGHGMTVLNPGTRCHPGYAPLADLVCTFEGPWDIYQRLAAPSPEFANAAHLVYGVPSEELSAASELLASRATAGLITDLTAPLPYYGIPSWLSARATQVLA